MKQIILAILATFLVFGCATTAKGPYYIKAKVPNISENESLIYVLRTDSSPELLGDRSVSIDGSRAKLVGDHGFLTFVKPAGVYTIEFGIPWGQRNIWEKYQPDKITLETESGKKYFVQFYTDIQDYGGVVEMGVGYRNMSHDTKSRVLNITEAEKVLSNHRLQE